MASSAKSLLQKRAMTWLSQWLPAEVEWRLTAASWDYRTSQNDHEVNVIYEFLWQGHTSKVFNSKDYIISPTIPSFFLWQDGAFHSFAFVFFLSLCLYIFIYYCWHEDSSPFRWSLDNDLPWGSVEQSSGEGKTNFSSRISDWKLLWIYYCTNCTDLLLRCGWWKDITNTPLEVQMKAYVLLVSSKFI